MHILTFVTEHMSFRTCLGIWYAISIWPYPPTVWSSKTFDCFWVNFTFTYQNVIMLAINLIALYKDEKVRSQVHALLKLFFLLYCHRLHCFYWPVPMRTIFFFFFDIFCLLCSSVAWVIVKMIWHLNFVKLLYCHQLVKYGSHGIVGIQ